VAALCTWCAPSLAADEAAVARGKVLFSAGGCANCHTDSKNKGALLAGRRTLKTPFGTFYAPNITPDPTHGIGKWTDAQFVRAMREGKAPDGSHYFPVFPYTSFTFMTDADMRAIKAYIFTLPPVAQPNRAHDVGFPFSLRFLQFFWKLLFFEEGPYQAVPSRTPEWNRGAYLARAVAHCAECHTPRNFLGGLDKSRWFMGAAAENGPEGEAVPNIRSDGTRGIGKWSREQIATYLGSGETPSGDFAGSLMYDVIDEGTSELSEEDRAAIATYLKDLPPIL
jgi:mono/diheme cytochrome c family protein